MRLADLPSHARARRFLGASSRSPKPLCSPVNSKTLGCVRKSTFPGIQELDRLATAALVARIGAKGSASSPSGTSTRLKRILESFFIFKTMIVTAVRLATAAL